MMVSSESQNGLDSLVKKIDAALTFPKKRVVVDGTTEKSNSEFNSVEEFLKHLEKMRNVYISQRPQKLYLRPRFISSRFPAPQPISKSKILNDQKLYDAILYSKVFENELDFARNRDEYQGEMVWVEMNFPPGMALFGPSVHTTVLIAGDEIIYDIHGNYIDMIREDFKKRWALLKEEVKKNLVEALSVPVSIPEPSKYVSNLQSSFSAAVSSNALINECQKMATMTEETKKILLDELVSLNVDPRLKRQYEFDLKLFADKDVYYWRDRLDTLRCSAPVSSPESPELELLRQKVTDLEKITVNLRQEIASASTLTEKVSKLEEQISRNESRPSTSTDTSSKIQMDASLVTEHQNMNKGTGSQSNDIPLASDVSVRLSQLEEEVSQNESQQSASTETSSKEIDARVTVHGTRNNKEVVEDCEEEGYEDYDDNQDCEDDQYYEDHQDFDDYHGYTDYEDDRDYQNYADYEDNHYYEDYQDFDECCD